MSATSNCALRATNLVIRDGLGYVLDETVQQPGMILIPQEPQQPVLFREWFHSFENIRQPPVIYCVSGSEVQDWERTNMQRIPLRLRSESSFSLRGEQSMSESDSTLSSISPICLALFTVR